MTFMNYEPICRLYVVVSLYYINGSKFTKTDENCLTEQNISDLQRLCLPHTLVSAFIQKNNKLISHRLCPTNHGGVRAYKNDAIILLFSNGQVDKTWI
jgi:hypothetical protein